MAKPLSILVLFLLAAAATTATASGGGAAEIGWIPGRSECRGSVGECLGGEEFDLGSSEINRRILATTRYISYNALRRDSIPCSRRGASYYNCRPGAQANPYHRGCSAITRCRS